MIIRRRHTANFTTIGNVLFKDVRLKADEVGIIAYLLSQPDNWEVRRPQLAKRFGYGREAIKRVMWNGMRFGWIVAQKTQLSDGRFFTNYEIRDEPGPELTDEEIRRALSLESSEARDSETDGSDEPDGGDTGDPPATADPPTGQPSVGQPATGNPYVVSKEETTKNGFTNEQPTKRARDFAEVKAQWPPQHILSIVACETLHAGLTDALKEDAYNGVKPYLDDCRNQNRKICDLATFYRERRWERFVTKGLRPAFFIVKRGTAQAVRWREHFERYEPSKVRMFDEWMRTRGEYTTRTEWPPAQQSQPMKEVG